MATLTMRKGKPFRRIKGSWVQAHEGHGVLAAGGRHCGGDFGEDSG
jgi:hypothetical protein